MKNEHLPEWCRKLVSDDVEWQVRAHSIETSQEDTGGEVFNLEVTFYDAITTALSMEGSRSDHFLWPHFPSPAHAIHAAETMVRCLRGDALPMTLSQLKDAVKEGFSLDLPHPSPGHAMPEDKP